MNIVLTTEHVRTILDALTVNIESTYDTITQAVPPLDDVTAVEKLTKIHQDSWLVLIKLAEYSAQARKLVEELPVLGQDEK